MRANAANNVVACRGGDRTALEARPIPEPGPHELLLRLRVVGLCGTDLFKLDTGATLPGLVLGHEIVGTVVAHGRDAAAFCVGDRIAVPHHVPCGECRLCQHGNETMCTSFRENLLEPGGFADHILVKRRAVETAARCLPEHVSDAAAVFMEPAACVLRGIRRSSIGGRGLAVVLGGGSMGLLHLLVLKAVTPRLQVIVVEPLAQRRQLAEQLGAEAGVQPGPETHELILTRTEGLGADAVFDTIGGPDPLATALNLSRQGGSVILFAHAADGARADFDLNALFKYERRIVGTYSGSVTEQAEIFRLLVETRLDPAPLVTHTLALDHFQDGVDLARQRAALKVLFTPSLAAVGAAP